MDDETGPVGSAVLVVEAGVGKDQNSDGSKAAAERSAEKGSFCKVSNGSS
jgi:hypothetical protein